MLLVRAILNDGTTMDCLTESPEDAEEMRQLLLGFESVAEVLVREGTGLGQFVMVASGRAGRVFPHRAALRCATWVFT